MELVLGRAAVALLPGRRRVVVLDDGVEVPYDGRVIATGSRVRTLSAGNEHAAHRRSGDDAAELRKRLEDAERVAILGPASSGSRVASTLEDTGREVMVVEVAPCPWLAAAPGG